MSEENRSGFNGPDDYQRSSQAWKPILIVGAVVLVIAVVSSQPKTLAHEEEEVRSSVATFSDLAILSGIKRTSLATEFKSGEATAVMGGVDIDLRDALMEGDEAVLDVSSVMGGVKVRVPKSWTVISRVSTIMGGFKDDTRHPPDDDHRLILKGTVVMGGLNVSN